MKVLYVVLPFRTCICMEALFCYIYVCVEVLKVHFFFWSHLCMCGSIACTLFCHILYMLKYLKCKHSHVHCLIILVYVWEICTCTLFYHTCVCVESRTCTLFYRTCGCAEALTCIALSYLCACVPTECSQLT